jgi:ribosomal protein L33
VIALKNRGMIQRPNQLSNQERISLSKYDHECELTLQFKEIVKPYIGTRV